MFRGEKLVSDLKTIGQVFKIPPPSEHIHIIVELPATTDVKLSYTPRLGGIGGTMILATEGERVGTYEGINLNSPDICHREQTIQKLVEKISKVGFLLVRSPPMSGKTSLGQLLEQHLVKDPNIRVIRISLLWMGIPSGTWTFEEEFERLMSITWKKFQDECGHIRTIFIVDEVQMLYVPQGEHETASRHKGNVFWETVKRCQQISNLSIVAFAAYGYKGAWDLSSATYTIDVSPFMILPENTWSIEDVRFTEEEYKDYFLRFCSTHLKNMDDEDDINYLQEYGFRGFAHIKNLTPEEEVLCDRVFRGPINIRQSYSKSGKVKRLVRTNLLSEQDGKLDFASPYLRALYLQRRWGSTIRPIIPPQDFKSFLRGTFTNMNAEAIRNSYCVGTDGRLLERAWQMEFYRAATQVLPADIFISPDVGTYWGSSGYMDFFVGDGRSWAIELLRDGEKASDHKSRINNIYKPIRKISKEWAIIDIRHPGLPNNNPEYSADHHWINVYCQEGWKSVIIEDKDEKVEVKLMGEYL
ncbi:hypothetical protein RhiirC2_715452 [Rhizophagus irregularis]|uniref:Crinkler family protein n=1 Tax=Rhizophagus irregularis TaxID=588596 RepID=A0A2N1MVD3_9GLOM|nr:hypothetical protein RhiirC2_715452 [Rhizophagus irregularis]